MLNLLWMGNAEAGFVDLHDNRIYRRGKPERETLNRCRPYAIPERRLPYLLRWRRLTTHGTCGHADEIIQRQKVGFGLPSDSPSWMKTARRARSNTPA
ncbi:hypothetical protein QOZ96_001234 [Brevundimonas nasdae]|uniref:hypothetical protein n=1 Tax=Brevundimonas nasdae TaxID=172043 RepID=UPI0019112854|nr:hypothetical protein [Brevundimonas nasdae]MBK6024745.1 hypothetical protein [Brevundimonas nasdae]MDQ0451291.1 hypothetical protein [Brevundimonas nasdae]